MAQDPLASFTDKFLSNDALKCVKCRYLLRPPIMINKDGNMCGKCYNSLEIKPTNYVQNKILELILNELKFPCKYQSNGCEEQIVYEELENHHNVCEYKDRYCLMHDLNNCSWNGKQADFFNHFLEVHSDFVVKYEENSFLTVEDLTNNSNTIRLLKGKNEDAFIMKCKINLEMNCIGYTIYYVDKNCSDKYRCTITLIGANNCINVTAKCTLKPYHAMYETEQDLEVKIVLSPLREITQKPESITVRIDIKSNYEETNEILLKILECPICENFMRPPIYQCNIGHSICSTCKSQINNSCPTCRGQFSNIRNYALENLTTNVHYSCIYHHLGCKKISLLNDITRHENTCNFKTYECPIDVCDFIGNLLVVTNHLKSMHPRNLILSHIHRFQINCGHEFCKLFSNEINYRIGITETFQTQRYHFITFNNIFRFSFHIKHSSKLRHAFWAVEILSNYDENDTYFFEIGILNSKKSNLKMTQTKECLRDTSIDFNLSSQANLSKICICMSNENLSPYIIDNLLTFYCKIRKQI